MQWGNDSVSKRRFISLHSIILFNKNYDVNNLLSAHLFVL